MKDSTTSAPANCIAGAVSSLAFTVLGCGGLESSMHAKSGVVRDNHVAKKLESGVGIDDIGCHSLRGGETKDTHNDIKSPSPRSDFAHPDS